MNNDPFGFEAYYYAPSGTYFIQDQRGAWIEIRENSLRLHLKIAEIDTVPREGKTMDALNLLIARYHRERAVCWKGSLAGYEAGMHAQGGDNILVTTSPKYIQPVKGDWTIIRTLLEGMYKAHRGIDQTPYVYLWARQAWRAFTSKKFIPGPAFIQAGPSMAGKTLVGVIFTNMLGGRNASSFRYMTGRTDFNPELFGSEVLLIDDEQASKDVKSRRTLGFHIKNFCFAQGHSCHGKGRNAITLFPFWRLLIMLNDEPENLLILPPIDPSLEDKLLLLKVYRKTMPMPTSTPAQEAAFKARLMAELPAFIYFLDKEFEPRLQPGDHIDSRTGCINFKHPDLLEGLQELSAEHQFHSFLEAVIYPQGPKWSGRASGLQKELMESEFRSEVIKLLDFNNAVGTYLGKLARLYPSRFKYQKKSYSRIWTILRPADWDSEASLDEKDQDASPSPDWEEIADQDEKKG